MTNENFKEAVNNRNLDQTLKGTLIKIGQVKEKTATLVPDSIILAFRGEHIHTHLSVAQRAELLGRIATMVGDRIVENNKKFEAM